MAQKIQQANIFGRLGSGIGQGLAEQLPKEIERTRLSKGLQDFEKESSGLSPLQQYARIAGIPGITPSMLQVLPDILKQQNARQSLIQGSEARKKSEMEPIIRKSKKAPAETEGTPSITTPSSLEATLNPYIPRSLEQLQQRAGELLKEQPGLYLDPKDALQEDQQFQQQQQALESKRGKQQDVQSRLEKELESQVGTLGARIPGNVFSEYQDKAINALKPKSEGGEGLTEKQAAKKYGNELFNVAKDYQAISTLGDLKLITRSPSGNKSAIRSIVKSAKERGDQENIMNEIIANQKLSPSKASYLTYPVTDNKELSNSISSLQDITPKFTVSRGFPEYPTLPENELLEKTRKASEKIAKNIKPTDSILSIAEELKSRGYDPKAFVDYVDQNRKKLNITERQARELNQPRDFTPTINDMWMFYFSGLDPIVETK